MTNVSRAMLSLVVTLVVPLAMLSPAGMTSAGAAPSKNEKAAPSATQAAHGKANACGCYKDAAGGCMCGKKAHCGCPGECEPKSCAEKQSKDIEREIKAATKQAEAMERKQKAASKSKGESSSEASDGGSKTPAKKTKSPP
jgi:hypothetical protein